MADSAGVVAAVGEGVTEFSVGDRVTSHFYSTWHDGPWLGQYARRGRPVSTRSTASGPSAAICMC